ncbi:transposase [Streptomyces sp. A0642]|nr:transposase [Streptomyces sp. A0642]
MTRQHPGRRRPQGPGPAGRPQEPGQRRRRHCRLAYSEILADEKKETAVGFRQRAHACFAAAGVTVQRVLTDNGSCCKSYLWRNSLPRQGISPKRARPYRPQTNGKVERVNRTLLDEWAYARPYRPEACQAEASRQTRRAHRGRRRQLHQEAEATQNPAISHPAPASGGGSAGRSARLSASAGRTPLS